MGSLTILSTIGLIWKDYLHLVIIRPSYVPFKRKQLGRHQALINLYCSSNGKNSRVLTILSSLELIWKVYFQEVMIVVEF